MFEEISYEDILERILDRIPDDTLDKREGSVIYDAVAPCAFEIKLAYIELDEMYRQAFADTADREYLIRKCAEIGIIPEPATYAILKGVFVPSTLDITIGTRFNFDSINCTVISKISDGVYQLRCETVGVIGNSAIGSLIPIDYIAGLQTATTTEVLIPGEEEEDTELLRARYFNHFKSQAYGGNVADYIEKTNAIAGVGSTKVTPVWNGGGTVLLTILDSTYSTPTPTLVDSVQSVIDPSQDAKGLGLAPIGHIVTVHPADSMFVNVASHITVAATTTFEALKPAIEAAIESYFLKLRQDWASEAFTTVRISQIETKILQVEGVLDVELTTLNGLPSNIELTPYQVPVFGGVTNE